METELNKDSDGSEKMKQENVPVGILRFDIGSRSRRLSSDFRLRTQGEPTSPQPSVLSVTFAEDSLKSDASTKCNYYNPIQQVKMEKRTVSQANTEGEESDEEEYSVSVNAIFQRRASQRRSRKRSGRRGSSPFSPDVLPGSDGARRRSSVFTSSSGETAITIDDNVSPTQEEIFENIKLHKEVLSNVKMQPWAMRKKLKLVVQAKSYIKAHEGALQERLAQSHSTRDMLARWNLYLVKKWQQFRREFRNFSAWVIPWELRIKEIESHFGSVVASYFTFLRWLFWINIVISVVIISFVTVPELIIGHYSEGRKSILIEEKYNSTNFLTLVDFEGLFKYSPMFYGWYSNRDEKEKNKYRLPFAYFVTGLAVYAYSFFATLRKMAENSRMSKLSEKGDECIFSWKLFTGWDYMIGNTETAHNRVASIVMGFKEALLEEAEKKREPRNWSIIGFRVLVNMIIIGLFAFSSWAVTIVVKRSREPEAQQSAWRRSEITFVMSLISQTFPIIFELLGLLEQYHPRKQLRMQLGRILMLYLLNLYSMMFSTFDEIASMTKELDELRSNRIICHVECDNNNNIITEPLSLALTSLALKLYVKNKTVFSSDLKALNHIPPNTEQGNFTQNLQLYNTSIEADSYEEYYEEYFDHLTIEYPETTTPSIITSPTYNTTNFSTFGLNDYGQVSHWDNQSVTEKIEDVMNRTDLLMNATITSTETIVENNETEIPDLDFENLHFEFFDYLLQVLYDFEMNLLNNTDKENSTSTSTSAVTEAITYPISETTTQLFTNFSDSTNQTDAPVISVSVPASASASASTSTSTSSTTSYDYSNESTSITPSIPSINSNCSRICENVNITNDTSPPNYEMKRRLRSLCWETSFGQELVKLTVMDLILTVLSTLGMDFVRGIFVRFMNRCWCWDLEKRFPQYGDFKVAENILHLVNNQGMVWMGMFFSPGIIAMNVVKLWVLMYFRGWVVLTCNVPHEVIFRASRSNNFYYALLLLMLFLCVLPVGYTIVAIRPSPHCGPFSKYSRIYHIFTTTIYSAVPKNFHHVLDYIASPGTVIPLLVLLVLVIYYLVSLTNALREANNDLKIQLRRERTEERRRMFQIADRRHRGGSAEMNNPYAKWKNILDRLPNTKSIDETPKNSSLENPLPQDDTRQHVSRNKDFFSKLVKKALRKASTSEGEINHNLDECTDTDQHESLPDDVTSVKESRFKVHAPLKPTLSSSSTELPAVVPVHGYLTMRNAQKIGSYGDSLDSYDSKPFNITEKLQKQPIPKLELNLKKIYQPNTVNKHNEATRQDSNSSVTSIPVITISKTESKENILDEKEINQTNVDNDSIDFGQNIPKRVDDNNDEECKKIVKNSKTFKPKIKYALKKQCSEIDEGFIFHFNKDADKALEHGITLEPVSEVIFSNTTPPYDLVSSASTQDDGQLEISSSDDTEVIESSQMTVVDAEAPEEILEEDVAVEEHLPRTPIVSVESTETQKSFTNDGSSTQTESSSSYREYSFN